MSLGADAGPALRRTLFGDMPLGEWCGEGQAGEPWALFYQARDSLSKGEWADARARLQQVLDTAGLESRHYLQAWQALREIGFPPPAGISKRVLGVVVEVAMKEGLDLLAAYADLSVRYYNYAGAGVVWDRPNESLDEPISKLLEAGQRIADQIGPWDGARPGVPPNGHVRISMLTPSGIHLGQGPFAALSGDQLGGAVIGEATRLMQRLVERSERDR